MTDYPSPPLDQVKPMLTTILDEFALSHCGRIFAELRGRDQMAILDRFRREFANRVQRQRSWQASELRREVRRG